MKQVSRIRFAVFFTSLLAVFALAGCGGHERAGGGTQGSNKPLTIKGSDTMVILGQRFAEVYMAKHPGTVVQVNGGGSGTGIAALINGTVDLAQASRMMKPNEKEKAAKARGAEIVEQPVALDALAVFVNDGNPITHLTIPQVRDIFIGKTKNWRDVGGPDATIVLYGRENSSGTYDFFREHVLEKADFSPKVQTLQGTAAIINAVGHDKNGIGYGGIAYAKEVRPIAIAAEGGQPIAPAKASVADGTYPLARNLFYYYPKNAPPRVTDYVTWSLGAEAQALVSQVGYFPLATTEHETQETGSATDSTGTAPATSSTQTPSTQNP